MRRGLFLTVEGVEGAGKTTCLASVRALLESRGERVVMTREPGGTALGEAIRGLLLGHDYAGMSTEAETLLVFAARAEHLAKVVRPALEQGSVVVCDRFTDATYAYQGGGRGLADSRIAQLEDWVQQGLQPDLTLLLDLPVDQGLARAGQRSAPDRFESEQSAFFERARACYRERAARYPERIRVIDASVSVDEVRAQILAVLEQFYRER